MTVADIDLWEINEAFASVVLKARQELDLDPEQVNVNGGAMRSATRSGRPAPCS